MIKRVILFASIIVNVSLSAQAGSGGSFTGTSDYVRANNRQHFNSAWNDAVAKARRYCAKKGQGYQVLYYTCTPGIGVSCWRVTVDAICLN